MIFGWGFPWALPKATLSMAVGQLWCGGASQTQGCALGYRKTAIQA